MLIALVSALAAAAAAAAARPVGLPVWVQAAPDTHYIAKCHIRTFKDHAGNFANGELQGFANTYYIDSKGPFRDRIPSPNAQCLISRTSGAGDVVLHIVKDGDHSVRVSTSNTFIRLNVW